MDHRPAGERVRRLGGIGRALARRLPLAGTLLGLALAAWLVATHDLTAVGDAFSRAGLSGLLVVTAMRAAILLMCGIAWQRLLAGLDRANEDRAGLAPFLILRFVREGINVLLPVASVGGEVVGGRLLTFWGVSGPLAAASLLADMLIQVATQVAFTLAGVTLLWRIEGEAARTLAIWTLEAAALALFVLTGFFAAQRLRPQRLGRKALAAFGRQFRPENDGGTGFGAGLQEALDAIWSLRRLPAQAQGFLLHLAAWGLGAVEIWIALSLIGVEVGVSQAIVLEALSQAIKSAAFPVPSGLGVQEGGFVVVGALIGIDADTAIALSLIKRVPDVLLGLPSLIVWQMLEARGATVATGRR